MEGENGKLSGELRKEWYGTELPEPVRYAFQVLDGKLVYTAGQHRAVKIHPTAKPGDFVEGLWEYDTAEFFISNAEGTRYMEFNLSPNGAWWACVFTEPRVRDLAAPPLTSVETRGNIAPDGSWECRVSLPLAYLETIGINPAHCRLAAAAIQNSPDYLYLTTSNDLHGEPDFHRPWSWDITSLV